MIMDEIKEKENKKTIVKNALFVIFPVILFFLSAFTMYSDVF